MKILFDHQIFEMQKYGGISRYFFELIKTFDKNGDVNWELPIRFSRNEYLKNISKFRDTLLPKSEIKDEKDKFLWGMKFKGKGILFRIKKRISPGIIIDKESELNKSAVIEKLQKGNYDIFHPTYYDEYFLNYIGDKPFVLTVYDLIHQIFPEFGMYETRDKNKNLLQKAKKIIAISESTKRDLVSIFDIDERKIAVTHLAHFIQENNTVSDDFKNKLPLKYILFVGHREAYKNFLFFAQLFGSLSEKQKDLYVVCTGSPFNSGEHYFFNKLGIEDKMFHTVVNDNELAYLYKNAIAFIFPSMYEGFGLPVLEAFSCGCPVLVSSSSSLLEIGEDAVIYFEPKNPASMLHALTEVLNNSDLRSEKIAKGYQQLQKFSWNKTATETRQIYSQILSEVY